MALYLDIPLEIKRFPAFSSKTWFTEEPVSSDDLLVMQLSRPISRRIDGIMGLVRKGETDPTKLFLRCIGGLQGVTVLYEEEPIRTPFNSLYFCTDDLSTSLYRVGEIDPVDKVTGYASLMIGWTLLQRITEMNNS